MPLWTNFIWWSKVVQTNDVWPHIIHKNPDQWQLDNRILGVFAELSIIAHGSLNKIP